MADSQGRRPRDEPAPVGARAVARRVLERVEQEGAFSGRALSAELERARLSPADRGLATELVYGVLRRRARLDRALAALSSRGLGAVVPQGLVALRVGAYQILFLDRIPDHAAVDDAVERCKAVGGKGLAGFANAILRRLIRDGEPALPDPARDALGYMVEACGLPAWLGRMVMGELGAHEAVAFAEALMTPAPLTLRANTLRATAEDVRARLASERPDAVVATSPLVAEALVVRHLDGLASTTLYREGLVAVQDLGAQVVALATGAEPGERILDACAGVGGKTAHLAALAGNRATLEAVDRSKAKLGEAEASNRRLGVTGVSSRVADLVTDAIGPAVYDRVLLDAPCSGLGVLRRHPEALWSRGPADLAALTERQGLMLARLAPRVRPGGLLVYAVCTFERAETTDVIAAFLATEVGAAFTVERPTLANLVPLVGDDGFVRTWPHRHDADAFFCARLRRRA